METLQNKTFTWELDAAQWQLGLTDRRNGTQALAHIQPGLAVWRGSATQWFSVLDQGFEVHPQDRVVDPQHGLLQVLTITRDDPVTGLRMGLEVGLGEQEPLALLRLWVENRGQDAVNLGRFIFFDQAPIDMRGPVNGQAFYVNGWQSWSRSGVYGVKDRPRRSRLGPMQKPMICNPGTPEPGRPGHFSSDFFCAFGNRQQQQGFVVGFLSQKEQFGSFEACLGEMPVLSCWANADEAVLLPGRQMKTDWLAVAPLDMDSADPMEVYLDAAARENEVRLPEKTLTGWCSWYHFYQNISQEKILTNLDALVGLREWLPVDLVQIDDGFETQIGDWYTFQRGFPDGVEKLAVEIARQQFMAGIWLAPFIVHPTAKLARQHPEYLLKTRSGRFANAGFVWNRFNYALDLTHPGVLDECRALIYTAVEQWKFPYLKLDFLYAAALKGVYHDPTMTRAQVLRQGMEALREAAGAETLLLGCGLPLGSGLGLVDAMRIGPDTAPTWDPTYSGVGFLFRDEPSMPAGRNSLQNILSRAMLHRKWWINDPDCVLLRPETDYSLDEIRAMATVIGMTGGMLLLSDDLPALTLDRLQIAEVFLPLLDRRGEVLDWFEKETPERVRLPLKNDTGDWWLVACFNWRDQAQKVTLRSDDFKLPHGRYWVRSFWDGSPARIHSGEILFEGEIAAHGVLLLAVRSAELDEAQYLGSNLHFSQGMEVSSWQAEENRITICLELKRNFKGVMAVYLPLEPMRIKVDGMDTAWQSFGEGRYRINVEGSGSAEVVILFPAAA